jgi:hypothetical protein
VTRFPGHRMSRLAGSDATGFLGLNPAAVTARMLGRGRSEVRKNPSDSCHR